MLVTPKIKMIYKEIQRKLIYMLPEKWDSIYLYASVIQHAKLQTGEMFFYYIPKGVLRKNPVNVYEVPARFNIEEEDYLKLADGLYSEIKNLRDEMIRKHERPWSNVTMSLERVNFKAEFRYDDLTSSRFNNTDRHLAWKVEYLNKPLTSLNKQERHVVEDYFKERSIIANDVEVYTETVYVQKDVKSIIDFEKEEYENDIEEDLQIELKKEEPKKENKNELLITKTELPIEKPIEHKAKSQILNF